MTVHQHNYDREEISRLGEEIYNQTIRNQVMPHQKGKFLVLDIETGDYEVDDDDLQAEKRLRSRDPQGILYGMRIGYTSAYTLSGRMIEENAE